ncbi:MAG TPA: DEAD/DEAH box helicase [Bacteroidales bacterium]|nr:DEAD/DEAH box helicase [Bacteroidales bacterium]
MKFEELEIDNRIKEGIESFNYEELTKIQEIVIPVIISGIDLLACSQTGSGKTAAFLIPIIESILKSDRKGTKALIITPTREICMQIEEQISGIGYFTDISYLAVYGGNDQDSFSRQKSALTNGADIIVATPGRLISHLGLGYFNLKELEFLVLDEADEMLDMGFYPDIINIISNLPVKRQNLMFSATMPQEIRKLAKEILENPEVVDLNFSKPAVEIEQKAYLVFEKDKQSLLVSVLKDYPEQKILIFVSTKLNVGKISSFLKMNRIKHSAINSSFSQSERNETVLSFKSGQINVLVATNLLSRGIDIEDVNLIINYDIPEKAEDYVHRIGRTARAGKLGLAISLISEFDINKFNRIEKLLNRIIVKLNLPEGFRGAPQYSVRSTKKSGRNFKKTNFKRIDDNSGNKQHKRFNPSRKRNSGN